MPVVEIYFKVGASVYIDTDSGEIEEYYIDDDDEQFEEDWYYLEDGTRPSPEICARAPSPRIPTSSGPVSPWTRASAGGTRGRHRLRRPRPTTTRTTTPSSARTPRPRRHAARPTGEAGTARSSAGGS